MSDSVRPHRRQPTRLLGPWHSSGNNTGVGCHFLLQCMKVKSEVAQSCPTPSDPRDCSLPGSSVHAIFQATALEWGAVAKCKSVKALASQGGTPGHPHHLSLLQPSCVPLLMLNPDEKLQSLPQCRPAYLNPACPPRARLNR